MHNLFFLLSLISQLRCRFYKEFSDYKEIFGISGNSKNLKVLKLESILRGVFREYMYLQNTI